jgi:hypothetical protein
MARLQTPEIIEAIQAAVHKYGVKELASKMDMAPSTLYQKVNPWGERSISKIGLEEFLEIISITGDRVALDLINKEFSEDTPVIDESPAGGFVMAAYDAVHAYLKQAKTDRKPYTKLHKPLMIAIESLEQVFIAARREQGGECLVLSDPEASLFDGKHPVLWVVKTSQNRTK